MRRGWLLLAVLVLGVAPAAAQDVVKFGQIEAQTGANAIYGWMSSQGAALAVDEVNKAGGFKAGGKTYKIQLIALDTRGEPKEATVQLKRLVEVDGAKYIFGPFLSNVFLAIRPYAAEWNGKILMWGGATRIHDYVGTSGHEFLMRTWNWDAGPNGFGELMVDNLLRTTGARKIAMLFQNDQGGKVLEDIYVPMFKKKGIEYRLDYFEPGTKDFSASSPRSRPGSRTSSSRATPTPISTISCGRRRRPASSRSSSSCVDPRTRPEEQGRHRGVHRVHPQVLRGGREEGSQGGQVHQGLQGFLQAGLPVRPGSPLLGLLLRPRLHARRGDEEGRHRRRSRGRQEGADGDDLRRALEDPLRRARQAIFNFDVVRLKKGGALEVTHINPS